MTVPTRTVREGRATLHVPDVPLPKGPGTKSPLPFYNPTMAVNRDFTVLALRRLGSGTLLDALSGCGALAVRAGLECPGWTVTAADRNPDAVALIRRNLAGNGVAGAAAVADLRDALPAGTFDHGDIDPFGSPAPFLATLLAHPALRSATVTATDTGALSGIFPGACERRYGLRMVRTTCASEMGLRALLAYVSRTAAASGRRIRPLFVLAAEHFLKVAVRLESGPPDPVRHYEVTRGRPSFADEGHGPVWAGPLFDPDFLAGASTAPWMDHRTAVLLSRLQAESVGPPFYHTLADLSRRFGPGTPKMEDLLRGLRDRGHAATRTHLAPDGLRTDADLNAIRAVGW